MCGRFAFYSPGEATAALFGVSGALPVEARYNIAPTQYIAAIRNDGEDDRELTMLRWGLVPFWAKDPSIGNRMINARAETVAEKPSYRAAYRHRRCLVLADGFYEWHTEGGIKRPHYISAADGQPFAFAALWENWQSKVSDESIQSTTIITTEANEFMSALHHRMPVVLRSETADRWLAGDEDLIEFAASHGPELQSWVVDRRVNNARNEGEDLIEAVS
jgi:putative SOS response-associated peptidase YedK